MNDGRRILRVADFVSGFRIFRQGTFLTVLVRGRRDTKRLNSRICASLNYQVSASFLADVLGARRS